jgi:hypothetical protein
MAESEGSLEANRAGRLSPSQRDQLQNALRNRNSGLWGRIRSTWDPLRKDVSAARVEAIEGAISKREWYGEDLLFHTPETVSTKSYRISVANRQDGKHEFRAARNVYDSAPSAGWVRLFYLPLSRLVVDFEPLPHAPSEELTPDGVRNVIRAAGAARRERDEVGVSETAADMASIGQSFQAFQADGPPAAAQRLDPSGLADALVGTWSSPFITVTFGADGAVTARMAAAGDQTGRWSVSADGRLHADVMGGSVAAEAYIAEGWLTLGIDAEWFRLQRSA